MCGIVGYCTKKQVQESQAALKRAVGLLKHRGPDGSGYHFSQEVGLGHSRLAIIDVLTGEQPLFNEDGTLALVVNGEFYNYRRLNRVLEQSGHRFKSRSDSETFIHLYEDLSISEALNSLNGMWALALWDENRKRLVLARDRAGKKPLYYSLSSSRLLFASEIKALLTFPDLDLSIDETALALYLKYGYVPAPYSIYKAIHKFPAASYGVYEKGQLSIQPYWQLPDSVDHSHTEAEWREELSETLDDAVKLRLVSDVPLGAFLSGGIDSSLIVSDMTHHVQGRVKSFCIGFDDPSYDESAHAQTTARYLGTEHHMHTVKFDKVDELPYLASHFDEPFADASSLPTWFLCKYTKEHVTVSLSGDGGDELFGGYRRYLAGRLSGAYLSIPKNIRGRFIEAIVNRLPAPGGYYGNSIFKKAKLFVAAANRYEQNPMDLSPSVFTDEDLVSIFPDLVTPSYGKDPLLSATALSPDYNTVETMLRNDFITYLPDDILVKVDRMSMYHALEVRCPFLDHRVVEIAHRMPLKFKIMGFNSKAIIRRIAETQLPSQICKRSKQGFMLPLDIWFRRELKSFIHDILNDRNALWSKTQASELLKEHIRGQRDHALKLWSLAVLGLWSKKSTDKN